MDARDIHVYGVEFQGRTYYDEFLLLEAKQGPSLYDRLGGVFAIAAVVNAFSDAVLASPVVGKNSKNPQLRQWSRNQSAERLPGLKWMRTLWVCDVTGGPQKFVPTRDEPSPLNLSVAHARFKITSDEFDEVAKILATTLAKFKVPSSAKDEVLKAFAAHKKEVVSV